MLSKYENKAGGSRPRGPMIAPHGPDWCHVCGSRVASLADVFWADNAEHDPTFNRRNYIRVCAACAGRIHAAATMKESNHETE